MSDKGIPNRFDWSFEEVFGTYETISKERLINSYRRYFYNVLSRVFEWKGLPDSIPQKFLELFLFGGGMVIITKATNGKFYAFRKSIGGGRNAYYYPYTAIVNNPWIRDDKGNIKPFNDSKMVIGEDCVVIYNDSTALGVGDIVDKYSLLLAEATLSLRIATINSRIPRTFYADNDNVKDDLDEYLKMIEKGEEIGAIGGNPFFEGIKTLEYNSSQNQTIKELIEEIQYLKSSFFLEVGLQANYNMKREAINESEAGMNESALLPISDDWLENRKDGVKELRRVYPDVFGEVDVEFASAWRKTRKDLDSQEVKKEENNEDINIKEIKKDESTEKDK